MESYKGEPEKDPLPQLRRFMTLGLSSLAWDLGNENCIVYGITQVKSVFTFYQMRYGSHDERQSDTRNLNFFSRIGRKDVRNPAEMVEIIYFLDAVFSSAQENLLPALEGRKWRRIKWLSSENDDENEEDCDDGSGNNTKGETPKRKLSTSDASGDGSENERKKKQKDI